MVVDFVLKRAPKYRVASVRFNASYSEARIRAEFARIAKWAKAQGLRTGKWFFSEDGPGPKYRFDLAIEVRGAAKSDGNVRVRTLPASPVASITFDPEQLSARVAYHGLQDWLRYQVREKKIKRARSWREVYEADPWTDKKAWSKAEIQVVVTK